MEAVSWDSVILGFIAATALTFVLNALLQDWWNDRQPSRAVRWVWHRVASKLPAILTKPLFRHVSLHKTQAGSICVGDLVIPGFHLLDGISPQGIDFVVTSEQSFAYLPDELRPLRRELEEQYRRRGAKGGNIPYNAETTALKSFHFTRSEDGSEKPICRQTVQRNEYFNIMAVHTNLSAIIPGTAMSVRDRYFKDRDPRIIEHPALFTAFPVNLAIITADDRLLVVRRSETVALNPGAYDSSVDEAVHTVKDRDSAGILRYDSAGRRALVDELGIESDKIADLKFTAVGYDYRSHEYAILGHARLSISYEAVMHRLHTARDSAYEIAISNNKHFEVTGVPFEPFALSRFLQQHLTAERPIVSYGLACYLVAFLSQGYTHASLDRPFRGDFFKRDDIIR